MLAYNIYSIQLYFWFNIIYIFKTKKEMNNYNYLFKFIVIGDTGVGKSCVVLQFI